MKSDACGLFFLSVVFVVFVLNDSQSFGNRFDGIDDFFLYQIEGHGQQSDAEQQVKGTEGNAYFYVFFDVLRGHKVAKSDSCQGNKTKVSRVEEGPLFPSAEKEGTAEYVADDQQNAQPDGHRFVVVLIGFIFVRVDVVVLVDVVVIVVHFFLLGQPTETVAAAAAPSSRCSGYSRRPLSRSGERVTRTRAGWIDKIYIYPGEDLKEKKK